MQRASRRVLLGVASAALAVWVGVEIVGRVQRTAPDLGRWHEAIRKAAADSDLDPALMAALVAAESGGDPGARSHAGAAGLAQLMLPTAQEEALRRGWGSVDPKTLLRPDVNLRLGASYLRRMLDAFDGEAAYAIAAYNAGPGRMRRWLRESEGKGWSPRELIQHKAFAETRRHVEKVLAWHATYRARGVVSGTP